MAAPKPSSQQRSPASAGGGGQPANGSQQASPSQRMDEEQVAEQIKALPDWSENGGSIQRTYQFQNFLESMRFVNRVAEQAEAEQHHPDILVRWNKVTLTLSTHDAGGITSKDFALAAKSDEFGKAIAGPAAPKSGAGAKKPVGKK